MTDTNRLCAPVTREEWDRESSKLSLLMAAAGVAGAENEMAKYAGLHDALLKEGSLRSVGTPVCEYAAEYKGEIRCLGIYPSLEEAEKRMVLEGHKIDELPVCLHSPHRAYARIPIEKCTARASLIKSRERRLATSGTLISAHA